MEVIINASVAVRQNDGKILFLRELRDGAANRSYGIQVAGLAGLPDDVIDRAGVGLLDNLEKVAQGGGNCAGKGELPRPALVFLLKQVSHQTAQAKSKSKGGSKADARKARTLSELAEMDINAMTPVQALVALDRLQKKLKSK